MTYDKSNSHHFPRWKGEWKEISQQVVYNNPWIKVTHSEVQNPNGGKGTYGVVQFKNIALGIIPIDEEGYTYIVGQERFPLEGKFTWEIIEGGGPLEEDPLISAKRELREEAGLSAKRWNLIQEMEISNSATTERALIYLARGLEKVEARPEATEKLQLRHIPFAELEREVLEGNITDSLSVVGTLRACRLLHRV